jgi:uncharacterized protein involved in exopolysaccharide biosynthesis
MKRWIALAAALYPRSWREEFGDEFDALLDDVGPGWRVFANVLRGAIRMQMTTETNWLKLVAAMAVAGAIVAGGASFLVPPHYVSSAVISVTPQPDPVRPTSPQVLQERAAERLAVLESQVLSRSGLSVIIQEPSLDLYKAERKRIPLEDVIQEMRSNIRIQARSSTDGGLAPIVYGFSFSYPDQIKVQAVVRELATKFTEDNVWMNRMGDDAYREFWQDMSAYNDARPAPPPPVGEMVGGLNQASLPRESGPNRIISLAWGLSSGLVLGLLAALAMRWPRGLWRLSGFAAAGCVLACAASFLISDRYTSTGEIMLSPALITEDPLASIPPATPAAEFLRHMEPQILSSQHVSWIIQDMRLNLYPKERATGSAEEAIKKMLLDDVHFAVLNPAPGTQGAASAFTISFSYPDRYKAQQVVQALMNTFAELYQNQKKADADASKSATLRLITQRKAGEVLDVIDTASLPMSPETPNRLAIAAAGLVIGLLLGAITLYLRRPRTATLQPA